MNAYEVPDNRLDPDECEVSDWDDLDREAQIELLMQAMHDHPKLIEEFHLEALASGVDPLEYAAV